MGDIDTVLTRYETDASQAISETRNLHEAEAALRGGTEAAGGAFKGLGERLLEYRREEVQQSRATRFFAMQLGEILPEGAGLAGKALGALAVAGTGIGLAFEGVKLVVQAIHSEFEAAAKVTEDTRKAFEKVEEECRILKKEVDNIFADFDKTAERAGLTAAEKLVAGVVDKFNEKGLELKGAFDSVQKRVSEAFAGGADNESPVIQALYGERGALEEKREELKRQLLEALQEGEKLITQERSRENQVGKAQLAMAIEDAQNEATKLRAQWAAQDEADEMVHWQKKVGFFKLEGDEQASLKKQEVDEMKRLGLQMLENEREQVAEERRIQAERKAFIMESLSLVKEGVEVLASEQIDALKREGTENRNYTAAFSAYSIERREQQLLEEGVVKSASEARRVAGDEAKAAEDKKTAAEKEAMSERLAALALEWGAKAIGAAADGNVPGAILYGAAAVAAGGYAAELHGEAASLQQNRGFTGAENDSLRNQSSFATSSAASRNASTNGAGGTGLSPTVQVFFQGNALLTKAEVAASLEELQNYLGSMRGR